MRIFFFFLAVIVSLFFYSCGNSSTSNSNDSLDHTAAMTGKEVYDLYCVACHGADGKMNFSGASDLSKSILPLEDRIFQITHGKGVMNAFKDIIPQEEIENVAIYIESLRE